MISGIIKVEVSAVTLTETFTIPDITKKTPPIIVLLNIVLKKITKSALLKRRIDEPCFNFAVCKVPLTTCEWPFLY